MPDSPVPKEPRRWTLHGLDGDIEVVGQNAILRTNELVPVVESSYAEGLQERIDELEAKAEEVILNHGLELTRFMRELAEWKQRAETAEAAATSFDDDAQRWRNEAGNEHARVRVLEEALRFYADKDNYHDGRAGRWITEAGNPCFGSGFNETEFEEEIAGEYARAALAPSSMGDGPDASPEPPTPDRTEALLRAIDSAMGQVAAVRVNHPNILLGDAALALADVREHLAPSWPPAPSPEPTQAPRAGSIEEWYAAILNCQTCRGTRRKSCDQSHNYPSVVAKFTAAECPWCADLLADGKAEGCEQHYPVRRIDPAPLAVGDEGEPAKHVPIKGDSSLLPCATCGGPRSSSRVDWPCQAQEFASVVKESLTAGPVPPEGQVPEGGEAWTIEDFAAELRHDDMVRKLGGEPAVSWADLGSYDKAEWLDLARFAYQQCGGSRLAAPEHVALVGPSSPPVEGEAQAAGPLCDYCVGRGAVETIAPSERDPNGPCWLCSAPGVSA